MNLIVSESISLSISKLARYVLKIGNDCLQKKGIFLISLSGGSSPKRLYELLATDLYAKELDWTKVYFFFGDERNVPHDHPDSNFGMVDTAFFKPLHIPSNNIFAFNTLLGPDECAKDYFSRMQAFFEEFTDSSECRMDLSLLGLGDNSHTASLFPHTPILKDVIPNIKAVYLLDQNAFRFSMNAPLINLSHHIAFLVFGNNKSLAVKHVLEDPKNIEEFPAQLITPRMGSVIWFLDAEASSQLKTL
jgi:6-phosphogluconolactonase